MWTRLMSGEYGWKTVAGVVCMIVALGCDIVGVLAGVWIDRLFGLGQIIAFFGLRDAIRKQ